MNNGRRVELDVTYNNAPFAGQVGAEIESLTYVDNAADDSDSIDITLDAQDSKWLHGWLPQEGATLRPRIIGRDWNGPGDTHVDTNVQAEEAGAESSGILAGEINILVDPIPYIASVSNVDESTGGLDVEDDDSLTERAYLAPSRFSCAGPRDAYEYHVREWRSDVTDVQITSPEPCVIAIYFVMEGGRLPNATEREELAEYISGENLRPLCDKVVCVEPEEVPYNIAFTYWIGDGDQRSAGTIQEKVTAAVQSYQSWQRHLGRDINPTELIAKIREAGAKRVKLTAPADIVVGRTQLPKCTGQTVTYGGLEDD